MRALTAKRYGPLEDLRVIDLARPEPGVGEVRVRVVASALNPADYKVAQGRMTFLHGRRFPLVLGYDYSGVVEALGPGVRQPSVGTSVYGFLPYGPGNHRGAFAEALVARADQMAAKPAGVSHAQAAAAATPGATALQSLRDLAGLGGRDGQSVLITGVSGGVGAIAVAVAVRLGVSVTALGSPRGLDAARAVGARELVDRAQEDVLKTATGPYDAVFDAAAAYRWSQWRSAIKPGGGYVTTLPSAAFLRDKLASLLRGPRCAVVMVQSRPSDLQTLAAWLASGLVVGVDGEVSLDEVPSALARLERGDTQGRIVVRLSAA